MVSAVVGGIASAVGGAAANKLLGGGGGGGGGGSTQARSELLPITAGGIRARFRDRGDIRVSTSAERQALINRLRRSFRSQGRTIGGLAPQFQDVFQTQLDELGGLREQLQPGFGALTEARLAEIENARQRALGNLRESLAQRRVTGSSFAQAQQAQAEREFAQAAAEARAVSRLEELDATQRLIDAQFQTGLQSLNTALQLIQTEASLTRAGTEAELQEQNRLAELAANLQVGAQTVLNNTAQFNARAAQESLAGTGQFIGQTGVASAIGQGIGGLVQRGLSGGFSPSFGSTFSGSNPLAAAGLTGGNVFFPGSGTTVDFTSGRVA